MPEPAHPAFDAETIRRMAGDLLKLSLKPAEVDALQALLDPLLAEVRQVASRDRVGAEPEPRVVVEEWTE
jgi:hypothetical protein